MGIRKNYTKYGFIYYLTFHYQLNHIEYFWYDGKSETSKNCKYSIKELRDNIPKVLAQVKESAILKYYKNCPKKIDLYREKIRYGIVK